MNKKLEKYKKQTAELKKIFFNNTEASFIVTIQINSIKGNIIDKLKKYGEFTNLVVKFLNYKKIKNIFILNQIYLQNINNEIILFKGTKGLVQLTQLMEYLKELNIENHISIINILISSQSGKFIEIGEFEYKEKIKFSNELTKKTFITDIYKLLKVKIFEYNLRLIQLLKKKCQQ